MFLINVNLNTFVHHYVNVSTFVHSPALIRHIKLKQSKKLTSVHRSEKCKMLVSKEKCANQNVQKYLHVQCKCNLS